MSLFGGCPSIAANSQIDARICSQLTARNGLNEKKMETSLKTIKNQHATDHDFTDWQDLRESVQDDTEYENHWHAVCVRAQEQALSNAAQNAELGTVSCGDCSCAPDYYCRENIGVDKESITNKQNLVQ